MAEIARFPLTATLGGAAWAPIEAESRGTGDFAADNPLLNQPVAGPADGDETISAGFDSARISPVGRKTGLLYPDATDSAGGAGIGTGARDISKARCRAGNPSCTTWLTAIFGAGAAKRLINSPFPVKRGQNSPTAITIVAASPAQRSVGQANQGPLLDRTTASAAGTPTASPTPARASTSRHSPHSPKWPNTSLRSRSLSACSAKAVRMLASG